MCRAGAPPRYFPRLNPLPDAWREGDCGILKPYLCVPQAGGGLVCSEAFDWTSNGSVTITLVTEVAHRTEMTVWRWHKGGPFSPAPTSLSEQLSRVSGGGGD